MLGKAEADATTMTWRSDLAVGIPEMDADHKVLFTRINAVVQAISAGGTRQEVDTVFAELLTSIIGHFAREERMLKDRGYEYADGHSLQHAHILEELAEIKASYLYESGQDALEEVKEFLSGWLANHIIDHDFGYRDYFARHPLASSV